MRGKVSSGKLSHERIFPYGTYKHDVELAVSLANGQSRQFNFSGIVQLKTDTTQVVGLSQFGTTVFKLTENLKTGEIQTQIFLEEMKKGESRIRDYYGILREILNGSNLKQPAQLKWTKTNAAGYPIEMETVGAPDITLLKITQFDENQVPVEFSMDNSKFHIKVKVTEYEI
jgi:hypothetical protein